MTVTILVVLVAIVVSSLIAFKVGREAGYREGTVKADNLEANDWDTGYSDGYQKGLTKGLSGTHAEVYDRGRKDGYAAACVDFGCGYDAGWEAGQAAAEHECRLLSQQRQTSGSS